MLLLQGSEYDVLCVFKNILNSDFVCNNPQGEENNSIWPV
jgi:hypothetical protein